MLRELFNTLTYRTSPDRDHAAGLTGTASLDFGPTPATLIADLTTGMPDIDAIAHTDALKTIAAARRTATIPGPAHTSRPDRAYAARQAA